MRPVCRVSWKDMLHRHPSWPMWRFPLNAGQRRTSWSAGDLEWGQCLVRAMLRSQYVSSSVTMGTAVTLHPLLCTYCHSSVRFYYGHINSLLPQPTARQTEVTQERLKTLLCSQVIFVLPLLDLQPWYGGDQTFWRISSRCVGSMVNYIRFC